MRQFVKSLRGRAARPRRARGSRTASTSERSHRRVGRGTGSSQFPQ